MDLDAAQNRVIVGSEDDLARDRLIVDEWVDRDFAPGAAGLMGSGRLKNWPRS